LQSRIASAWPSRGEPAGPRIPASASQNTGQRTGLIAQEAPPRLGWPSGWCRQIARDGGLGNRVPEHEKLTVDSWRTPEKVLPGHLSYQIAHLTGDPADAHLASDPMTDIARTLTSRYGASARRSRAERSSGFRAIAATSATARSKTADRCDGSMGAEFGCAPARQFGGAGRSPPATARCAFGVRFGRPDPLCWSAWP
jgi:hypothetical protein